MSNSVKAGGRCDISIVIPAYNEARRIAPTLEKVQSYLDNTGLTYEIIVVDDGSTDNTAEVVKEFCQRRSSWSLLANGANRGKGYSVRRGMLEASGDYILFSDADLSTPIEEMDSLLKQVKDGFDIAIGIRGVPGAALYVPQPFYREWAGAAFTFTISLVTGLRVADTQCGFKCYRASVAKHIFQKQMISGFSFDVENLYLAKKYGYKVKEVPVEWVNDPNSRLRLFRDATMMFADLVKIRINNLKGKY